MSLIADRARRCQLIKNKKATMKHNCNIERRSFYFFISGKLIMKDLTPTTF
jgi:hypothetical protein